MGQYRTTIKAREKQAQDYAQLIRVAFDYEDVVWVEAQVEGQPNPDRDYWLVRAEVAPRTFIMFKIAPVQIQVTGEKVQPVLAAIIEPSNTTKLRETLYGDDIEEVRIWISRAWMALNGQPGF